MTRFLRRYTWKILMLTGIALLVSAGVTQWERYKAEETYQSLAQLRDETIIEGSFLDGSALTTEDGGRDQDHGYVFEFRENPTREWLNINPDFMGWITIENTNINYPYVRSRDNMDYLDMDFYRNKSAAGAIFMDYRNLGNFNDRHMILYGHNMKSRTMFHQLNKYREKEYFDNNPLIQLSGLYEEKAYQVFSVYEVSANEYVFQLNFLNDEDYLHYLEGLASLSLFSSGIKPDTSRKLLTLATCSYGVENGRFVVHALEL